MMTSARQPDDLVAAPARTDEERTFLGHPIGLTILFLTEMWERFGFYGMRAILVFYMIKGLAFSQPRSSQVYGWYIGLVYLTPIAGGWLADRFIGYKRAILLGGAVLAAGYFMLGLGRPELFYPALAVLILGNGAFKANISTVVGKLYKPGDPRRDRGFGIFYVGINVGAAFSPLVCGTLGERYGWKWGFLAAGVGMIIGIITFLVGQPLLKGVNMGRGDGGDQPTAQVQQDGEVPPNERRETEFGRILSLCIIGFFVIFFWAAYEQGGNTLALWADENTIRNVHLPFIGAFEVPASWFQSVNPIFIFCITPLLNIVWFRLGQRNKEPGSAAKMTLGLFFLGLSFIVLMIAASAAGSNVGKVSMLWLISAYLVQTVGELALSPIGLSLVTKLAPARLGGMLMGVWFLAVFLGNKLSGTLGELYSKTSHVTFFSIFIASSLVAAVAMFFLLRPLKKLMAGAA
jgi:POT family proton-dependent oligopeptide transporter